MGRIDIVICLKKKKKQKLKEYEKEYQKTHQITKKPQYYNG